MSEELKAAQARIAELEGALSWHEEQRNDMAEIRAELAAIKAQEPVAWAGAIEYGVPLLMVEPQNWKATPLYAAPVSEAKAQGVVQWPEADEIMQMAFEEGQPADDASGYCFELEEFDLFIDRLMSEVARLNTAPAQQVSVPDEPTEAMRKAAQDKLASEGLIVTDWLIHTAYSAMLNAAPVSAGDDEFCDGNCTWLDHHPSCARAAAPAAPAADASDVLEQAMYTLISIGYHENSGLVHELRQALAAHSAEGVV